MERVKAYYGEIPPLTYLEESLLQDVKKLIPKDENNDQNNTGEAADNTNGATNNQQQGVPDQNQNPDGSYY